MAVLGVQVVSGPGSDDLASRLRRTTTAGWQSQRWIARASPLSSSPCRVAASMTWLLTSSSMTASRWRCRQASYG